MPLFRSSMHFIFYFQFRLWLKFWFNSFFLFFINYLFSSSDITWMDGFTWRGGGSVPLCLYNIGNLLTILWPCNFQWDGLFQHQDGRGWHLFSPTFFPHVPGGGLIIQLCEKEFPDCQSRLEYEPETWLLAQTKICMPVVLSIEPFLVLQLPNVQWHVSLIRFLSTFHIRSRLWHYPTISQVQLGHQSLTKNRI